MKEKKKNEKHGRGPFEPLKKVSIFRSLVFACDFRGEKKKPLLWLMTVFFFIISLEILFYSRLTKETDFKTLDLVLFRTGDRDRIGVEKGNH